MKIIAIAALLTAGAAAAQTTPSGFTPTPANPNPPHCSRTVTDNCVQNSARESDTTGGMPAHRHMRNHHRMTGMGHGMSNGGMANGGTPGTSGDSMGTGAQSGSANTPGTGMTPAPQR